MTDAAARTFSILRIERAGPDFRPVGPNEATRESSIPVPLAFFPGYRFVGEHIIDALHLSQHTVMKGMGEFINSTFMTGTAVFEPSYEVRKL
jgi:hypothetical protein